jgi:hypothetical protein
MFLGLTPAEEKFFSYLDLKDAFFCIGLAPQSQPIFAFQWKSPSTGTIYWTIVLEGTIDLDSVATRLQKLSHYLWDCLVSNLKASKLTSMAAHSSST